MSRPYATRYRAFLTAALFLLAVGGDAYGYHGCPHHDALPADGDVPHAHSDADPSVDRTIAFDGARSDSDASPDGHSGPCTCVGSCHGSATSPALSVPSADARVEPGAVIVRSPVERSASIPERHAYLLPFANGPPVR